MRGIVFALLVFGIIFQKLPWWAVIFLLLIPHLPV